MEFLKQYELLVKKAKVDFKVAKNLLEDFENGDDELDLEVIMFHLQQASEKLLKALLAYNKVHITKTHDIKALIKLLDANNIEYLENTSCLIPLTYYAVEGRYSILHDDIDDVSLFVTFIAQLVLDIEKRVKK